MRLVNIGFNNMVAGERIVALVSFDSAPSKRMVQDAKESGHAVDCTGGKKTKTVIITDSSHVILSSLEAEKISDRIAGGDTDE